jgi:hypothetical protein
MDQRRGAADTKILEKRQYDFVEECRAIFEAEPQPRRLGNFLCFWYN